MKTDTQKDRQADKSKERRDRLRDAGLCINGEKHGPATHGKLCKPCRDTHRKTDKPKTATTAMPPEPATNGQQPS